MASMSPDWPISLILYYTQLHAKPESWRARSMPGGRADTHIHSDLNLAYFLHLKLSSLIQRSNTCLNVCLALKGLCFVNLVWTASSGVCRL